MVWTLDSTLNVPESFMTPDLLEKFQIGRGKDKVLLYDHDEEREEYRLARARGLSVLGHFGYENRSTLGRDIQSSSSFSPRTGQEDSVNGILRSVHEYGGGILVAPCGQGKTVILAETILRIGKAACILVHKNFLAQQWEEAFKMLDSGVRVGRLQGDRCDTGETHDVVVAMVQSLTSSAREYPDEHFKSFGVLGLDEVHRYGADVWKTAIVKYPSKLRIGLTATPRRSDGMWDMMEAHIGPILHTMQGEKMSLKIYMVSTDAWVDPKKYNHKWLDDHGKRAKLITALSELRGRNKVLIRNIRRAWDAARKILVISERRKHLDTLCKGLLDTGVPESDIGFYVGGMKQKALDDAAMKDVIFSTYQMVKEGLDIPALDTLMMATPQYSIQQSIGRLLRKYEGKSDLVVLDLVDKEIGMFLGMSKGRRKQYRSLGYDVAINDNIKK